MGARLITELSNLHGYLVILIIIRELNIRSGSVSGTQKETERQTEGERREEGERDKEP